MIWWQRGFDCGDQPLWPLREGIPRAASRNGHDTVSSHEERSVSYCVIWRDSPAHHAPLRLHQRAGVYLRVRQTEQKKVKFFFTQTSFEVSLSYRPHPPPPIGGGVGPAPWFILPIRLRPGNPGGLRDTSQFKHVELKICASDDGGRVPTLCHH